MESTNWEEPLVTKLGDIMDTDERVAWEAIDAQEAIEWQRDVLLCDLQDWG